MLRTLRAKKEIQRPISADGATPHTKIVVYLLCAFFFVAAFNAARYGIRFAIAHPNGSWDSWGIWTLRARFLFRSETQWRNAFSPVLGWSHVDYPLLLPASIVRVWTYLQHEAPLAPTMLGLSFLVCTVGLVMSSLALLRSKSQGLLAGGVLVTTPFLLGHSVSGYAESPLMFFMLATIVLVVMAGDTAMPRFYVLAGIFAGCAAWTKNEGLFFLVCCVVAIALPGIWGRSRNSLRYALLFVLGTSPMLVLLILFKVQIQFNNWLFSSGNGSLSVWARLATPSRYFLVARYYGRELLQFGEWRITLLPFLLAYFILLGRTHGLRQRLGTLASMGALTLALIGEFFVYIVTPTDMEWLLSTSLNRLILQLWPAAVFIFFMVTRSPEEALAQVQDPDLGLQSTGVA
ncbi:MAG: hypothetical protein ABSD20_07145 [Terriglobales bacterium]